MTLYQNLWIFLFKSSYPFDALVQFLNRATGYRSDIG